MEDPFLPPHMVAELEGRQMTEAERRQKKRFDFNYETIVGLAEGRIDQDQFWSRMDILDAIDRGL